MIHGPHFDGLLQSFRDGDLPPSRRGAVEEHLARCPRCGAMLRRLAEIDAQLVAARPRPAPLAPEASEALFRRALAEAGRRPPAFAWWRTLPAWGAAALLVGAVAVSSRSAGRPEAPQGASSPWRLASRGGPRATDVGEVATPAVAEYPGAEGGSPLTHHGVRRARRPYRAFRARRLFARKGSRRSSAVQRLARASHLDSPKPEPPRQDESSPSRGGQMVVAVTDPDRMDVRIHDAPAATPGYARVAALQQDAYGNLTCARATVSSQEPGGELVLQLLNDPQ